MNGDKENYYEKDYKKIKISFNDYDLLGVFLVKVVNFVHNFF